MLLCLFVVCLVLGRMWPRQLSHRLIILNDRRRHARVVVAAAAAGGAGGAGVLGDHERVQGVAPGAPARGEAVIMRRGLEWVC